MKIITICSLFLLGCSSQKTESNKISRIDSLKNSIVGKWGGPDNSGIVWQITHDSIYFYDRNQAYYYSIIGNDMVIDLEPNKKRLKDITVTKDTLFFKDRVSLEHEIYGIVTAYRYK